MTGLPNGARAIMSSRIEPPDSLDFFPTPPWATRAMLKIMGMIGMLERGQIIRCPAAGEGHMAEVIREVGQFPVLASDVFDYGVGYKVASYIGTGPDVLRDDVKPAWVIENPPFNEIEAFLDRAMAEARCGVAFLVRSTWLYGQTRHAAIFAKRPPTHVFHYAERVPMKAGWWDPDGSTATDYCWVIWSTSALEKWRAGINRIQAAYAGFWIPPGQREALTMPDDHLRFPDRRTPEEKARAEEAAAKRKAARDPGGLLLLPPEGRA